MRNLLLALALTSASLSHAGVTVVYGYDTRKDVYQVTNSLHKKLMHSTAGMIHTVQFAKSALASGLMDILEASTLEDSQNLCATEKFSQQPTAPSCSGFLVGEDTLVTAGHCVIGIMRSPELACKSFAWVFDYSMKSVKDDPTKNIPMTNIYLCSKIIDARLDEQNDYAVIKLDRKVVGREPLKFRDSGKVADSATLVVIGHPTGLPLKVSSGGKVLNNREKNQFATSLDTFQGNSGSAVFNATTGLLEGILVQGKMDYRPSKMSNPNSCLVVNVCDKKGNHCRLTDDMDPEGEIVTRITTLVGSIKKSIALKK